ncbi:MAG TPA: protein-L-isoaspartate(D-aspartate) O-methyltransferase [Phycisphaerae bacterium]|nr:protein-L-isoaspartate(D-aspartate) O-methyltransferase [Phycisphaerae bacterium]HNU45452.1 protein-L-isoaspartate(D-aspartate) O-methyltransferase [Phycisphaerae bacterium]
MSESPDQQPDFLAQRRAMIFDHIHQRGLRDQRLLAAFEAVPRELFVPDHLRAAAYEDRPLPIGHGQTISQPYIVAYMTAQLDPLQDARVLEVGTGSGYQAAILAASGAHVYTIERIAELSAQAQERLRTLHLDGDVHFVVGDGSVGLLHHAPFERIIVTAAAARVPPPLIEQLADNGILIAPVGAESVQTIVRVVRTGRRTIETPLLGCRFVRLIGQEGARSSDAE